MNKVQLTIPSNLSEIPLEVYQKFLKIENPTPDDMISTFCGVPRELLSKFTAKSVEDASVSIGTALEGLNRDQPVVYKFTKDGVTYGLIPNMDEMSYGENKDITEYMSDWDTMHLAMGVLFRPIEKSKGDKYRIEDYNPIEHLQNMTDIPLNIAMGALVFFYNLTRDLLTATLNYLEGVEHLKMTSQEKELLENNGEVMKKSLVSLRETLGDLMKSQHSLFTNA